MRVPLVAAVLWTLAVAARADTRYYAVYWHDVRIGFSQVTTSSEPYEGKPAIRTDTHFERVVVYMGRRIASVTDTTGFVSLDNKALREISTSQAEGRTTWQCDFKFGEKNVEISQDANGKKLHTTLALPSAPFTFDEPALIALRCAKPGDVVEIPHFLAGLGVEHPAFVTLRLHTVGYSNIKVDGQMVRAIVCEEQYSDSSVRRNRYITPSGEEIRFEYPDASLVYAIAKKEFALSPPSKNLGDADIAYETCVLVERAGQKKIDHVDELVDMRVLLQGLDLATAPSDESQTVVKGDLAFKGGSTVYDDPWSVDVHPPQIADSVPESVGDAAKGQEQWTKPDMFMPSDDPKMKELAAKLIAKETTVVGAILAIKKYVGHLMKPKAEIGVPRDAVQILQDRTGTCSDYTILTITLLRAAGIASRAVSGLVTWDPSASLLFMHGWAEAWDGKRWIGVDATDKHDQLSACHIKLWQGDMESRLGYQMGDTSKARALIYFSQAHQR